MVDETRRKMVSEETDLDTMVALDTRWADEKVGTKLDLACGTEVRPGYRGVDYISPKDLLAKSDKFDGALPPQYDDFVEHDLFEFPWPFENDSIAAAYSSHFVEHIPHYIPGVSKSVTDDGWWHFFAELYRIMEDGGIVEIIHPFSRSDRAFWDPTHTRYIHHQTWFYLSKEFRLAIGMDHYVPDIDFEIVGIQTIHDPTALEGKSSDVLDFARQFYFNITDDLFVVLKANK